jgi:bacterioferritin (cytochrome b1)
MASGSALAAGDFVGSNNGNLALMMQSDGNLALYTFTMVDSCKKMSDGNTGGGVSANALYNIGNTGVPSSMTQVAYIDENSELHQYPSSNTQYSNTYTKMPGTITSGGDIPGGYYRNTNVNNCQAACNKNSECAGFLFSQNECALKNSKMYPNSARAAAPGIDLYLRGKTPVNPPFGATNATNNIDSVRYNKYVDGGAIGKNYGLANANSSQKEQLSQLQTKLDQLTRKLTNLTGRLGNGSLQAEAQITTNEQGVEEYLQDLNSNNDKIAQFSTSIENILSDSDIVVLQKNYDYLFWSILATGTVVVAMNIVKK